MSEFPEKDLKNNKVDIKLLLRLMPYVKPYIGHLIISLTVLMMIVAIELYQPILMGRAVDEFIINKDMEGVINVAVLYLISALAMFVLVYIQTMLLQYAGQKIIFKLRLDLFSKIQSLSIAFYNKNPIGRLVTRITNDTETLNELFTNVIVDSIKSIVMLIGVIITMLMFNQQLALITFSVIPFIIIFTILFKVKTRKIYRDIRRKLAEVNAFISEHISGMKVIQIFACEEQVMNRFKLKNQSLNESHLSQLQLFSIYRPSMYLLNISAFGLLVFFGGRMALEGTITVGVIVVFQRYISKFFEPIQELAEQFNVLQSSMASAERVFQLLDDDSMIENEGTVEVNQFKGKIEFKNVWFQYEKDEWVLKDVSFEVNPGETVAFVGATGAGKSTIQNLITRYYDIQKGEILIDGINIQNIDLKDLRRKIGQMQQDVFLFTGDIRQNIRLRNDDITDETIIDSARYVNADAFISKLDHQYDEKVYERGATFSAGQRQLISFARTLAFNPDILILDEATANIDTETEVLIQDAMDKLMKGRTTLVVAHRLSTIQKADQIIVMHKGSIREKGTHQELLSQKGIYYHLYQLQYDK